MTVLAANRVGGSAAGGLTHHSGSAAQDGRVMIPPETPHPAPYSPRPEPPQITQKNCPESH